MKLELLFVTLILDILTTSSCQDTQGRIINTRSGPIQGTTSYVLQKPVQTFLGIPYAKPPIGDLRFSKPEPKEPWAETFMATSMAPACIQNAIYPFPWYDFEPGKSEDCLYLNIWAPIDAKEDSKKAVMFWMHGGGPFGSNRKTVYDGRSLAAFGDVILVSPNFRLGLLGFFTSGTAELPGNNGLWDLITALHWVRDNIEFFGGDPDRITLHGESSGSFYVSLFCLSPFTKGLFSKAILQSGTAMLLQSNTVDMNVATSQRIAKAVDCATDDRNIENDTQNVLKCLKEKDAFELVNTLVSFNPASDMDFLPQYGDDLLPTPPYEVIKNGNFHHVPLLIGSNKDEGVNMVTMLPDVFGFFGEKDTLINKTYGTSLIQGTVDGFLHCSGADVASYYLDNIADEDYYAIRHQTHTANGEITLTCPTSYFAESYAESGMDVYYYLYTHRPSTTPWAPWMGTGHFEETQFVFGQPLLEPQRYTPEEQQLSQKMIETWTQFAKQGNPIFYHDWPTYNKQNHTLMIIDTGFNGNLGTGPSLENCNFLRRCFAL
ncbi:acetylcholinesterase-1 [Caerostris darwini]|uniref:Carboxylic ester hydrolase n=1 Tax=Caerostris darwini TaxID=1538125 RepID=A0AAV4UE35_9ARAC|nr:acetylcholinesterase-1 [Caerostris darwini]